MQIGSFDTRKFNVRRLGPELRIAVAISFVLYAIVHTAIVMGWLS